MFRNKPPKPESRAGSTKVYAELVALFETHYPRFVRYFLVRCDIQSEAEDLASELFQRALSSRASLPDSRAQLEAWLYTTAHNMAVDFFRRKKRTGASVPFDAVPEGFSHGDDSSQWASAIDQSQDLVRVARAFQHLSESQRHVLALRYADGLTGSEIARLLNKSPGSVREMQRAAIEKLRYILHDGRRHENHQEQQEDRGEQDGN